VSRKVILGPLKASFEDADFVTLMLSILAELTTFVILCVQGKICAQLDAALLNDEELAAYNTKWSSLPDPPHKNSP
jgi:hypothetical protein